MRTISERVADLIKYSEAYYAGRELISDVAFDALEEELRSLDPENSWFKQNRETAKSGFGVKFSHPYQFIGSIDKIHSVAESKILNAGRYVISAKLDGASLVTYFTAGKLDRALTRGDGLFGQDVTDKFLKIADKYAWQIPANFTGAIRGEVVFSQENWQLFKALRPEAKAPRNSSTGLVNNKVASEDLQFVDYVVYDVVATIDNSCEDYWALLEQFKLPLAPRKYFQDFCPTHDMLKNQYEDWLQLYPIDGVVIRDISARLFDAANSIFYYTGVKEAYKFQAETKIVDVLDIVWQMGKTGKFTPVVVIAPTELSGALVQNVTAHNAGAVKEKGIGIGAKIAVYRSGEVIPYLHEVVVPAAVKIPTHCPHCGSALTWTDSGKDIVCESSTCPELRKLAVYKYLECICKDIKGLGDGFLDAFVKELKANSILSLLQNANSWDDSPFTTLGKADNLIAKKVLASISAKAVDPELFLLGLGIPLLGETFSKELAGDSDALELIFRQIMDWRFVPDVCRVQGKSNFDLKLLSAVLDKLPGRVALANYILSAITEVREILAFLQAHGRLFKFKEKTQAKKRYYGCTGALSKGRKEIEAELALAGWELTDNVNKMEALINNDNTSSSSKNLKAKEAGKPIVTEAEFRAMYL